MRPLKHFNNQDMKEQCQKHGLPELIAWVFATSGPGDERESMLALHALDNFVQVSCQARPCAICPYPTQPSLMPGGIPIV